MVGQFWYLLRKCPINSLLRIFDGKSFSHLIQIITREWFLVTINYVLYGNLVKSNKSIWSWRHSPEFLNKGIEDVLVGVIIIHPSIIIPQLLLYFDLDFPMDCSHRISITVERTFQKKLKSVSCNWNELYQPQLSMTQPYCSQSSTCNFAKWKAYILEWYLLCYNLEEYRMDDLSAGFDCILGYLSELQLSEGSGSQQKSKIWLTGASKANVNEAKCQKRKQFLN